MGMVSSWLTSNLAERGRRWKRVPCCLRTHPHLWRSFPSSQKTHDKGNHHSSLFSLSDTHTHEGILTLHSLCTCILSMAPQYLGERDQNLPLTHTRPSWSGHWTSLQNLAQLHIFTRPVQPHTLKNQKNTGHRKHFITYFPPLRCIIKIPRIIFWIKITWSEYTSGLLW